MTTSHTPGPWVQEEPQLVNCPASGNIIADCRNPQYTDEGTVPEIDAECAANAAHIVRCVNSHDDLLAALNFLQANPNDPRAHRQAFDAIKKATP